MVPLKGEWTPFIDVNDQIEHYRLWGLIPPKSNKLRPVMAVDGYFAAPEPCEVVGYQRDACAVIKLADGYHAIYGEYLAQLQPDAMQKLPTGVCFAEILSRYIVLDIETTGFDFHRDRILEIAAVSYEYGNKISEFHALVNPGMLIPSDIVSLTGITQADVDSAPTLEDVASGFLNFIGDMPIVGHNALTFDVPFLSAQLSMQIENCVIDTLPMARKTFDLLPCHKLAYLNDTLHLESTGAHRALNDVETTNALLWACLAPRKYESYVNKAFLDHRLSQNGAAKRKPAMRQQGKVQTPSEPYAIRKFKKIDIKSITPSCDLSTSSGPLHGKTIVFTGTLKIDRAEAMQMAVDAGAILKTSVSRKTDYLVVGKQDITIVGMDGMSTKEEKAHEINQSGKAHVQIISEKEFLELVKKEGATTV